MPRKPKSHKSPERVTEPLRFRRYESIPVRDDEDIEDEELEEDWEELMEDYPELDDLDDLEDFLDNFEHEDSDKYKEPS